MGKRVKMTHKLCQEQSSPEPASSYIAVKFATGKSECFIGDQMVTEATKQTGELRALSTPNNYA